MTYVDGLVAAVPTNKKDEFIEHCRITAEVMKDCGVLNTAVCWGDDIRDGEITSFPMAVKLEEGETVVFFWIIWPDIATHDKGMKQLMEDPRMDHSRPYDLSRVIRGGFEVLLES
jgi:uncharacterized protein YbaA (DUF1428 family)